MQRRCWMLFLIEVPLMDIDGDRKAHIHKCWWFLHCWCFMKHIFEYFRLTGLFKNIEKISEGKKCLYPSHVLMSDKKHRLGWSCRCRKRLRFLRGRETEWIVWRLSSVTPKINYCQSWMEYYQFLVDQVSTVNFLWKYFLWSKSLVLSLEKLPYLHILAQKPSGPPDWSTAWHIQMIFPPTM